MDDEEGYDDEIRKADSWENDVEVENLQMDDEVLTVLIRWKDGTTNLVPAEVCYDKCPKAVGDSFACLC